MDGGAWKAAVHGVAEGRTGLSEFTFTFHFHALEREMAIHFSILAWRVPGMGEPGGLPSMGLHRVGHDWSDLAVAAYIKWCIERVFLLIYFFSIHCVMSKKKNDNLLSQIYSYRDQPKSWESLIYDIYKWYLNFKIENLYVDVKLIQTSH